MKQPKNRMYLLNEDIEKIHERYETLYKQVKSSSWLTKEQIDLECEVLEQKYKFEIEELSLYREAEYWERRAKIKAKMSWKKPWRRCWLWRILFQKLTNRAQDIIEAQAERDAEDYLTPLEKELEARKKAFEELYAEKAPEPQATQENVNDAATAGNKPSSEPSTAAIAAPMSEATPPLDKQPLSETVAESPAPEQQGKPKRGRKSKQPAADVAEPPPAPSTAHGALPGQIDITELVQNK